MVHEAEDGAAALAMVKERCYPSPGPAAPGMPTQNPPAADAAYEDGDGDMEAGAAAAGAGDGQNQSATATATAGAGVGVGAGGVGGRHASLAFRPYDAILMDFVMPVMDGPTATKVLPIYM